MDSPCVWRRAAGRPGPLRKTILEKCRLSYAQAMLPILRIIPVGGVLLAIAILILALHPPVGPHAHVTAAMTPARGALIAREQHPEWRQFLILAAFRRADALSKLRDLPDTPTRTAPLVRPEVIAPAKPAVDKPPEKIAGVHPGTTAAGDITGSTSSDAAIPVDIGESSSAELPVIPHKEMPPVIMMPAREIPTDESTAPVATQPKPEEMAPQPSAAKQATRAPAPKVDVIKAAAPAPVSVKQASRESPPKPEVIKAAAPAPKVDVIKAAAPDPVSVKQASRESPPKPEVIKAAAPAPKVEVIKAAAPEPVSVKQASRESPPKPEVIKAAAPAPKPEVIKAATPAPKPDEAKAAAPAPVTVRQASRAPAPEPAARPESKAAAPGPAPAKLASREVVLPPPRPKPQSRHAAHHRARPRHELRVARRARHVKKKQFEDYDLFRALFGIQPQSHYWRVELTAPR